MTAPNLTPEHLQALLDGATEGPWEFSGICIQDRSDEGNSVCYMGEPAQWAGDTPKMLPNCDPNARLIALAPDLARRVIELEAELAMRRCAGYVGQ